MAKVPVTLLKPLNGAPIGSRAEYDERDVKRLEALGAVRRVKADKAPKNKMEQPPLNKSEAPAKAPEKADEKKPEA